MRVFERIQKVILDFRDKRSWKQFHDPKNLAEAIAIEAGELMESFLWRTARASKKPSYKQLQNIKEEVADIFIFLIYLCNTLHIDLLREVENKLHINEKKYPVEKAKGTRKKYKDL